MTDSSEQPKGNPYPPCPRCDGDRINKIGHDRVTTDKWTPAPDEPSPLPLSSPPRDYVYLCERCGHSWKVSG